MDYAPSVATWNRLSMGALGVLALASAAPADVFDARNAISQVLETGIETGYVMPVMGDLTLYRGADLLELEALLPAAASACERSVRVSLFLDAHWPPDSDLVPVVRGDRMLALWDMPEGVSLLDLIADGWPEASATLDRFIEDNRQTVEVNRAAWVHDMVEHGLSHGWTMENVARSRAYLSGEVDKAVTQIMTTLTWSDRLRSSAKATLDHDIAQAHVVFEAETVAFVSRVGAYAYEHPRGAVGAEKALIQSRLDEARHAAEARYDTIMDQTLATRNAALADALLVVAKQRVRLRALDHYIVPILEGRCPEITQRMPL